MIYASENKHGPSAVLGFLSLKRRVCFAGSRCKTTQRLLHIFMPWHVFFPQCSSIHVPSCLKLQQSQKRVDKKVQLSLRNVLYTTFLSVVVGCTRNKHILSTSQSDSLPQLRRKRSVKWTSSKVLSNVGLFCTLPTIQQFAKIESIHSKKWFFMADNPLEPDPVCS